MLKVDDVKMMNLQTHRNSIVKHQYGKNFSILPQASGLRLPAFVEDNGVEPLTPCVQGRCSGQLS